jgi:hypothetical protein
MMCNAWEAADLGSWNSAHSSLQATAQRRGGGHREAGTEWGEVVQRESGRPTVEAGGRLRAGMMPVTALEPLLRLRPGEK